MIDIITRLCKHTFIYGIGNMAVLLPGFILVPLYTKILTPAEYGVLSIVTIFMGILTFIYELGMVAALTRQYYEYEPKEKRKAVVSTAFIFLLFWAVILTCLLMVFAPHVSKVLLNYYDFKNIVNIALLAVFFGSIIFVPQTVLRLEERSILFVILSLVRVILTVVFTVIYILVLKRGLSGVFEAMVLASMISAVIYLVFTYDRISLFKFSPKDLKDMLHLGMAFFPALFFSWIIDYSNRYILSLFADMAQVGVYSLGYKISQLMMILVKAFYLAWVPIMFSIALRENAGKVFSRIFTYFVFVLFFLVLGISLYSKEIVLLLSNAQYAEAYKVIPIVAVSGICYGMYVYFMTGLSVVKKVLNQPFILAFGAIANVVLSIVLIKKMGMTGAALATCLTYLIIASLTYFFAQRHYPIQYEMGRIIKVLAVFAAVYGASILFNMRFMGANPWIFNPVFLAIFLAALYGMGFFKKEEMAWLKKSFLAK